MDISFINANHARRAVGAVLRDGREVSDKNGLLGLIAGKCADCKDGAVCRFLKHLYDFVFLPFGVWRFS